MKSVAPIAKWALQVAVLALAYAAAGRLALLLAVPPGVATAAFPPAGIAMAAVLIWGYRVWPGVLLGALLLNLTNDPLSWNAASGALCIAVGSTAQALLGAFLVRRLVGFPSAYDSRIAVGRFVLYSGPVACLTSATLSITALWLMGFMTHDLLFNWFTWWVGDTIGVLVFLPLLLIAFGEPRDVWRRRWLSVGLPLVAAFSGTVLIFYLTELQQQTRQRLEFVRRTDAIDSKITEHIESSAEVVYAITMLFQSSDQVRRDEFERFVRRSLSRHSEILALGWVPRVPAEERAAFEQAARRDAALQTDQHLQQGLSAFEIKKWMPGNTWAPYRDDEKQEVFPVYYLEPYEANEAALGIDLRSNPSRRLALDTARDTGQAAATPPILLAQETGRCPGFLFLIPIYENGQPRESVGQRRENLKGYASGVFRIRDVVDATLTAFDHRDVILNIEDATASPPQALIHLEAQRDTSISARQLELQRIIAYEIGGRTWNLTFTPTERYLSSGLRNNTWGVFAAALMLTIAVTGSTLLVAGASEATLRGSEHRFRSMFELASVGIAQVAPDGTFLRVNQSLCDTLGYSRDELTRCTFQQVTHPDDLSEDAEHVQRLLDGKASSYTMEKRYLRKDNSIVWGNLNVTLVRDESNSPQYFISVIEDISKRKQAEDQLQEEQNLLRKLIELQEAERRMVALDIHDGITQDIFGAQLHLQGAVAGIKEQDSTAKFEFVESQLSKAIKECRRLITDLRPMILEEAGIIDAISHLVAEERERSGMMIVFRSDVDFDRLERRLEGAMFRVVQEALSNVRQHSQVKSAEIEMTQSNGHVDITIRDNGIGFDKSQIAKNSFGLRGIHERARLFGGSASIDSRPGEGTTVHIQMPLDVTE